MRHPCTIVQLYLNNLFYHLFSLSRGVLWPVPTRSRTPPFERN
jgi:hypothetical protein